MIKFFRRIRQKLLSENRFSKYLIYAIGEIILVMIGILLALQVNTWSNKKQAKIYEKKILIEIRNSLQKDLSLFKRLEKRLITKGQAIDTLLLVRNNKLSLSDEEIINAIEKSSYGILFSYDKGPYETLKSVGLERIKTDSLRNRLIRFYEVYLPRADLFIIDTYDQYRYTFEELTNELEAINFYENYFEPKDSSSYIVKSTYNVDKIHSMAYYNILVNQARIKNDYLLRIKSPIEETTEVLELVNKELSTRFKK